MLAPVALSVECTANRSSHDLAPHTRFLILDDDPDVGRLMRSMADSVGIESRFTSSQEEFFRWVEEWAPSHIAVDLVMPNMDGVQVLMCLAERACRASIIITSGVGDRVLDAARRSALEHGLNIAGVLSKPFAVAQFRALLVAVPDGDCPRGGGPATARSAIQRGISFQPTVEQLQRALDRQELRVAYQPKIDCFTGRLTGFEALVRWVHPTFGLLMPACFVPFAEQCGLIDRLTYAVLDLALGWLAQAFPEDAAAPAVAPSMAINISASALTDPMFVERIRACCSHYGIQPGRLILELTESTAMADPIASLALLTRIRVQGMHLSIDDFGTGFSSMLQLVRLPFSEIKIDKSFIFTALRSEESRSVVKSIVDLAHSLSLAVVAEGVEDTETMSYLRAIGCDQAQGYLIARPLSGDLAFEWAASN